MIRPSFYLLLSALAASSLAQDTSGCGKAQTFAGLTRRFTVTSSNVQRNFSVHLPRNYDANNQYPTILGFHGAGGVGLYFEADTRFSSTRWSDGRILVYPDGIDGVWATGIGGNSTTPLDEDLQFVSDLLDNLRSNFCIDSTRIYATGISNGGGIINRIACSPTVGANFAAFAPVAGAYTGFIRFGNATCQPYKTPIPIISFHGGNDTIVPYTGRTGAVATPDIMDWLNEWAERNRCGNATEETINGTVHHYTWDCDGIEKAMEHWKEDDMGHCWPSRSPNFSQLASGLLPTEIEGNDLIVEFFERWDVEDRGTGEQPSATETGGTLTSTESSSPSGTSEAPSQSTTGDGGSAAGRVAGSMGMVVFGMTIAMFGGWIIALV
ncbi:hypothetical protein ABW19_dt0200094 [Dactylella cylindrospora]|nr:hypothetical protein ABW19_dt0200094 [Dactylella cylindrospora]